MGDGADEDGVIFIEPLVAGGTARIFVTSSAGGGVLNSFFDFDASGGFGNNANEAFETVLTGGTEIVSIAVPANAVAGPTFARFRLSSAGNLGPKGAAADGEVEDYAVRVYSTIPPRDFGDAPATVYDTLSADFGPSHFVGGPYLGSIVDVESDGQGNATATGDGRDEDGVHFGEILFAGSSVAIEVTSSPGGGVLNSFFDFNANGQFGDIPAEIFQTTLAGGTETILVNVPANATTGKTYARFRISSAGGLSPLYWAADGEVEDYQVMILPALPNVCNQFEYFDSVIAPALPAGWTTVAELSPGDLWVTVGSGSDTAPNHAFVKNSDTAEALNRLTSPAVNIVGGIYGLKFRNYYNLENGWDAGVLEISINGGAPQDILAAGGSFIAGGYNFTMPTDWGQLRGRQAWTGDSGGYIDTIVNLPPAAIGQSVQFHWLEGTDNNTGVVGWSIDTIQLCRTGNLGDLPFDFGDAPDPTYPTLSANDGAGHVAGPALHLGAAIDSETDGQQNPNGTGDDANGDDEDGVTFSSALIAGTMASLDVVASAGGLLSAWVDFNADGDWSDPGEQVFQDLAVSAGTNTLSFMVPADAVAADTFARFRLSTQSGLMSDGLAPDGEIEDYQVSIGATVVGRYVFYNHSKWDGENAAANAADDAAIAVDKTPLRPGVKATFANYTSFDEGITGLMIDVDNLAGIPTLGDFLFRVGNNDKPYGNDLNNPADDWPFATLPSSITVRIGAGVGGTDRVTLTWAEGAIRNTWLQVTVLPTATTGLTEKDVFYFGNAVAEAGNAVGDAIVNATDEIKARENPRGPFNPAPINFAYDYNRDKLVNATDQLIAQQPHEPVHGPQADHTAVGADGRPG